MQIDDVLAQINAGKTGRPYKYTPQQKLEAMQTVWLWMEEGGFSFRGACGKAGFAPCSVLAWMKQLPELMFPDDEGAQASLRNAIKTSYDLAHAAREAHWQDILMNGGKERTVPAIFALKCSVGGREEWREAAAIDMAAIDEDGGDGTTRVEIDFGEDEAETEEHHEHAS